MDSKPTYSAQTAEQHADNLCHHADSAYLHCSKSTVCIHFLEGQVNLR